MTTITEIIARNLSQDKNLPSTIGAYLQSLDSTIPASTTFNPNEWAYENLALTLIDHAPTNPHLERVFQFFIEAAAASPNTEINCKLLAGIFDVFLNEEPAKHQTLLRHVQEVITLHREKLRSFLVRYLTHGLSYVREFKFAKSPSAEHPFANAMMNLFWDQLDESFLKDPETLASDPTFLRAVVRYQPKLATQWLPSALRLDSWDRPQALQAVSDETSDFDNELLELCQKLEQQDPGGAFQTLFNLNRAREDSYLQQTISSAKLPRAIQNPSAITLGFTHFPDELLSLFSQALDGPDSYDYIPSFTTDEYQALFQFAFENWEPNGSIFFNKIFDNVTVYRLPQLLKKTECCLASVAYPLVREKVLQRASNLKGAELADLWEIALSNHPHIFIVDLPNLITAGSKITREAAADALAKTSGNKAISIATSLLSAPNANSRLGAVSLLKKIGVTAIPALKAAHSDEKSEKVQTSIEEALSQLNAPLASNSQNKHPLNVTDLLAQIESDKRIKLPSAPWFDLSKFPLTQKDGTPLSEKAITFLIQKQSKHKTVDAAPGILPVLELLDREKNADSALALLNQWLDSDQVAKDRWALVLAGLLGDNRIIPALTPRIQPWCENSRHKLAEYAAQAISLLATEEALMILDTLANRYRSKFKNIGKACNAAFLAAAEARGVTPDELGDLVVPDLGFNSECHKEFDDGKIIAVLQPDFKITWLNPETEKETKSPPSNLSDEAKEELKTLRKILREAVKGQTARLEQMLVRQRRWPVARWQELFEEHPLLQSYAANLVWGIYSPNSELLRTFRRYPNGILAHGSGEMEDLEERDTQIGLVHPLELDAQTIATWRDHLGRFKIKPPFLQLDRPVEVLEKDHHNRREIIFTDKIDISYGTFIGRMNRLGWSRGSVVDAGGVTSYYKTFQSSEIETILNLEECWIGMDPVEQVTLGKALFAKLSTIDRGNYTYDDPQPNDPRVLPFGDVPPIVYSETIADLNALIAGKSE